jgi:hypothetical protein
MAAPRQRAECDWPTASFRRRGATKLLIPGLQAILAALGMAALVTLVASAPSPAVVADSASSFTRVEIFVPRRDPAAGCRRVVPLPRIVPGPAVLTGAMRQLLEGPTRAERRRGYGGWFSARTAGMLRSVRVAGSVAYVDFASFSRIIPNASSSCGSRLLLAQLDRTAKQFPTVRRAIYSFNGSRRAFYEWLQLSPPTA